MIRIFSLTLAAAALLALSAAPARAQFGNESNITGPRITGSELSGGGYQGGAFRGLRSAIYSNPNGTVVFSSLDVAAAFRGQVSRTADALRRGGLRSRVGPCAIPDSTQRDLLAVLEGGPGSEEAARRLTAALAGGAPEGSRQARAAAEVVEELTGLFQDRFEQDGRYVPAQAWADAMREFDAYLDRVPQEEIDACPAGLLAVHAVLNDFIDAGLQAAGTPAGG